MNCGSQIKSLENAEEVAAVTPAASTKTKTSDS
jgi:hypothetical protein